MKFKKSDLRYGDVIRFGEALEFSSYAGSFTADTFLVDVLPPEYGKKTPRVVLSLAEQPEREVSVKKWPAFEVVSRLPDEVEVIRPRFRSNPMILSRNMVRQNGEEWDERALLVRRALAAAARMGTALIVIKDFGYIEVWPVQEKPETEVIQRHLGGHFAVLRDHRLGEQFQVYAEEGALGRGGSMTNLTAQFALLGDPALREVELSHVPDPARQLHPGHIVILAGFALDEQTGMILRRPLLSPQAAD